MDRASDNELSELVEAVAAAGDDFWEWFAGSASFTSRSSPEYIAMTEISLAADSARIKLSRRQSG